MKLAPLILLAGGKSSRMGAPKALLVVEGRTWIRAQLGAYFAAGGSKAWVVTGFWADEIEAEVRGFALIARNPAPERGQFSSIQVGARAVLSDPSVERAFLLPIDTPAPGRETWETLMAGGDACVPTRAGKGGHPVLLSRSLLERLVAIDGGAPEARLDSQMRLASNVLRIEVADSRVRMNLNTPEDFRAYANELESGPRAQ